MKAIWRNYILAGSDHVVKEGDAYYFPPESVNWNYLIQNDHKETSGDFGDVQYFDLEINGIRVVDAAWKISATAKTSPLAEHVAFKKDLVNS